MRTARLTLPFVSVACAIALALAGCGPATSHTVGAVVVDPAAVLLGDVRVGVTTSAGLQIRNESDAPAALTALVFETEGGAPIPLDGSRELSALETSQPLPATLAPGASMFVRWRVTLRERGPWSAKVRASIGVGEWVVPVSACGRVSTVDTGRCENIPDVKMPAFYEDPRLYWYDDFVAWPDHEFKRGAKLGIAEAHYEDGRGLNLSGVGAGVRITYGKGRTAIVRMRREFETGSQPAGMVFGTSVSQNDDGLTISGDRIGARTHGTGYRLQGTALTSLLPQKGAPRSFAFVLDGPGPTFHTASQRFDPLDLGPGRNYDSLIVEALFVGTNPSGYDAWSAGPLYLERLAIFDVTLSDDETRKFIAQLDAL